MKKPGLIAVFLSMLAIAPAGAQERAASEATGGGTSPKPGLIVGSCWSGPATPPIGDPSAGEACRDSWTSRLLRGPVDAGRWGATTAAPAPIQPRTEAEEPERSFTLHDRGVPLDLTIADALRQSGLQESASLRTASGVFRLASLPGTLLLAATLYGIGEIEDRPDLSHLGLNTGRAVVGAGVVTLAGKVAAGRARPRVSPDDPTDFSPGRGLRGNDYQAFPSAHTAAAFAAATVLTSDLTERHPGSGPWVYPAVYGAAAMAGLSRLFDEEHWATDLLAGGVIGVIGGLFVSERYDSHAP